MTSRLRFRWWLLKRRVRGIEGVHRRVWLLPRLGVVVKIARVYRLGYASVAYQAWRQGKPEWHYVDHVNGEYYAVKTSHSLYWMLESFIENWTEWSLYREGSEHTWRPLLNRVYFSCGLISVETLVEPWEKDTYKDRLQQYMFRTLGFGVYGRDNHHLGNPGNYAKTPDGRVLFLDFGGPITRQIIKEHYRSLLQARPFA